MKRKNSAEYRGKRRHTAFLLPGLILAVMLACLIVHTAVPPHQRGKIGEASYADFSPQGTWIVTTHGGISGTMPHPAATLWNTRTGSRVIDLDSTSMTSSALFSPDEKWLITLPADRKVEVWNPVTGSKVTEISLTGLACDADYHPLADYLVISTCGPGENNIVVVNTATWQITAELMRFTDGGMSYVAYSPSGDRIAVACNDGERSLMIIFDSQSLQQLSRFEQDGSVNDMVWSKDEQYLVTGNNEAEVRFRDVATGELAKQITHVAPITSLDISPDNRWVAVGSSQVTVYSMYDFHIATVYGLPTASVRFSSDGSELVVATPETQMRFTRIFDVSGLD